MKINGYSFPSFKNWSAWRNARWMSCTREEYDAEVAFVRAITRGL